MTQQLVYAGAAEPYFEVAVTGRQRSWYRNQVQDVPDATAAQLLAAGAGFSVYTAGPLSSSDTSALKGLVSSAGNARKGQTALTFGSGDGWVSLFGGDTLAYDASNLFRTPQNLSYTAASGFAGVKRTLTNTVAIQSGAIIQIAIWLPESIADLASPPSVYLKLSSDGAATKNLAYTFGPNKLRTGGWNVLTVKAGEDGTTDYIDGAAWAPTGGEIWGNNFNYVDITLGNLSGVLCKFDSVVIGQKEKPRVVFSFDGVDPSISGVVAPALAQYGWKAGVFVDGNNVASSAAQLRILRDTYGWDVGTQGMNHTNYKTTPGGGSAAQLATDLPLSAAQFVANGFSTPNLFCYPSNAHNAACDALLSGSGFVWRRGMGLDILPPGGGVSTPNAIGNLVRSGFSQPLGANYVSIKNRIDAVCLAGGILSLFTHNASSKSSDWALGVDLSHWYAIVDYLALKSRTDGLMVIKPSEVTTNLANVQRF